MVFEPWGSFFFDSDGGVVVVDFKTVFSAFAFLICFLRGSSVFLSFVLAQLSGIDVARQLITSDRRTDTYWLLDTHTKLRSDKALLLKSVVMVSFLDMSEKWMQRIEST